MARLVRRIEGRVALIDRFRRGEKESDSPPRGMYGKAVGVVSPHGKA
jgi:hypothetical protein